VPILVKKNLNDQVYESLRQNIIDQKIPSGAKLINRDIQKQYGVSSTPVRDAIHRLHRDGLLENISNSGARVIQFTYSMAVELNEIMSMLNCGAVSLSAQKSDLKNMAPLLQQSIALQKKNIHTPQYYAYDEQFHHVFFDFCQNKRFKQLYQQYATLWALLSRLYYQDEQSSQDASIACHEQIMRAYCRHCIPEACAHMHDHFTSALLSFRKTFHTPSVDDPSDPSFPKKR